jgi:hypothetical protein
MSHISSPSLPSSTFGASNKEIVRVTWELGVELQNSTKKELVSMISRGSSSQEIT